MNVFVWCSSNATRKWQTNKKKTNHGSVQTVIGRCGLGGINVSTACLFKYCACLSAYATCLSAPMQCNMGRRIRGLLKASARHKWNRRPCNPTARSSERLRSTVRSFFQRKEIHRYVCRKSVFTLCSFFRADVNLTGFVLSWISVLRPMVIYSSVRDRKSEYGETPVCKNAAPSPHRNTACGCRSYFHWKLRHSLNVTFCFIFYSVVPFVFSLHIRLS